MGSIAPIAAEAISLFQTATTIAKVFDDSGKKNDALALQQLQQQQKLQERQAAQDAALSKKEIQEKAQAAEAERRNALKRAMARQRVQFGGNGIANGDGSSEAVLLGMFEESDEERVSREKLDKLKIEAINQNLLQQKRVNTLERTQTAARNKLINKSSNLNDLNRILGAF